MPTIEEFVIFQLLQTITKYKFTVKSDLNLFLTHPILKSSRARAPYAFFPFVPEPLLASLGILYAYLIHKPTSAVLKQF